MKTISSRFKIFYIWLSILYGLESYSQDVIFTKKQGEIRSKVIEIGVNEIKYKNYDSQEDSVVDIKKTDVIKIVYANGKEDVIKPATNNALKLHLFSPLFGHLAIGYEKVLKPGFNLETKIGIIGAGIQRFRNGRATGGFAKIGIKFLLGKNIAANEIKISQPLIGGYILLEIAFSHFIEKNIYSYDFTTGAYTHHSPDVITNAQACNIIFGKQLVIEKRYTFNAYIGVGYGSILQHLSDPNAVYFASSLYNFSHNFGDDYLPITLTSGISIGYIF